VIDLLLNAVIDLRRETAIDHRHHDALVTMPHITTLDRLYVTSLERLHTKQRNDRLQIAVIVLRRVKVIDRRRATTPERNMNPETDQVHAREINTIETGR